MSDMYAEITSALGVSLNPVESVDWRDVPFRPELAYPTFSDDLVERLRPYGTEELVPGNSTLYGYGDRAIDLFFVLDGEVNLYFRLPGAEEDVYTRLPESTFAGELNILCSQKAIVAARTVCDSRLLRIPRSQIQRLLRSEGDIANLIVQGAIWRRIGIIKGAAGGVELRGQAGDPETMLLKRFLVRNSYPHRVKDLSDDEGTGVHINLPAIRLTDGRILHRPTIPALADELGITELPDRGTVYDVAVVGAGPSGLAAALYSGSEGLRTIVIESLAPGGQAGTSSKIENYLGFPTGIGGLQLASRAHLQALKFGVQFAISREVVSLRACGGTYEIILSGGISVRTKSVVVASGARYRTLALENYKSYENCGLFYAATPMECFPCKEQEVVVVGGGNSAGQASLYLSGLAKHVHHVVRGASLSSTMSQYLISRIESSERITLYMNSEVSALEGHPKLQSVVWVNRGTGERTRREIARVFVMIGAEPNSGWLYGMVRLDPKGFVLTGAAAGAESTPYATSQPGIYAVGDVRANSVKRVASAVGEGSVVISDIHQYLATHASIDHSKS